MSVALSPSSSLGFNRPLTQLVKRVLTVTNNNDLPVAFKVKTTAPRLYCVRPNSGRIDPGETAEVLVLLQAMKEEPPTNVKCKDKFLVQSTLITPGKENLSAHDFWTSLEGQDSKVHQQKIKVVYLPAPGEAVEEEDDLYNQPSLHAPGGDSRYETTRSMVDSNGHADTSSIFPPMPEPQHQPPIPQEPKSPVDRTVSPPADFSNAREASHEEDRPSSRHGPASAYVHVNVHTPPMPLPSPPLMPVAQPVGPTEAERELRAQLSLAQAELERLRTLLASMPDPNAPELRRRTKAMSTFSDMDDDAETYVSDGQTYISDGQTTDAGTFLDSGVMIQPEGVPPQVVIMIAFGVFITTYLFF